MQTHSSPSGFPHSDEHTAWNSSGIHKMGRQTLVQGKFSDTLRMSVDLAKKSVSLWSWKGLESPLDSKEVKAVNPKGSQS